MRITASKFAYEKYCTVAACLIFGITAVQVCVAAKPMNVLFITIDDLRPELASYKTDGISTPHIDRLAAKGLQFNAAYCQYPVCNASRCSFLTGLRPDEHGIFANKVAFRSKWPDLVTLPQLFRGNGYFTAGLGKLFHMGTDEEGNQTLFRDDASFDYSLKAMGKEPKIGREGEREIRLIELRLASMHCLTTTTLRRLPTRIIVNSNAPITHAHPSWMLRWEKCSTRWIV